MYRKKREKLNPFSYFIRSTGGGTTPEPGNGWSSNSITIESALKSNSNSFQFAIIAFRRVTTNWINKWGNGHRRCCIKMGCRRAKVVSSLVRRPINYSEVKFCSCFMNSSFNGLPYFLSILFFPRPLTFVWRAKVSVFRHLRCTLSLH